MSTLIPITSSLGLLILNPSSKPPTLTLSFTNYNPTIPPSKAHERLHLSSSSPFLLNSFDQRFLNYDQFLLYSLNLEFFDQTLEKEFLIRKSSRIHFSEPELWSLISNIAKGLKALKEIRGYHGGIHPNALFRTNQGYKLADQGLFLGDLNWFYNYCLKNPNDSEVQGYLSPDLYYNLQKGLPPMSLPEKDDCFSLGMLLLSLMTFQPAFSFIEQREFSYSKIGYFLSQITREYSQKLKTLVERLLQKDESLRIGIEELLGLENKGFEGVLTSVEDFLKESSKKSSFKSLEKSPFHERESLNNSNPSFKTPEKQASQRIHKVSPGSLGKSSIKIVHTPTKRVEERNKVLEEEFDRNRRVLESEKQSTERSIGFLKETIEYLKSTNEKQRKL